MNSIVKIQGGLGNQLFCYAFSLYVQKLTGKPVQLDVHSGFKNYFFEHSLSLEKMGLDFNLADHKVLENSLKIVDSRLKRNVERRLNKLPLYKPKYVSERTHLRYDPTIAKRLSKHTYFEGYWQSYQYTDPVRQEIIDQLINFEDEKLVKPELLAEIREHSTVSIHIRYPHAFVGKRVSKSVQKRFNILSSEYYLAAIQKIKEKVSKPKFIIFSDNFDYAKELLPNDDDIVLMNQGYSDYVDILLMSQCENQIIANSTFSWWGAYLNTNPDKTVIAPYKWYLVDALNQNDLMPKDWITI